MTDNIKRLKELEIKNTKLYLRKKKYVKKFITDYKITLIKTILGCVRRRRNMTNLQLAHMDRRKIDLYEEVIRILRSDNSKEVLEISYKIITGDFSK